MLQITPYPDETYYSWICRIIQQLPEFQKNPERTIKQKGYSVIPAASIYFPHNTEIVTDNIEITEEELLKHIKTMDMSPLFLLGVNNSIIHSYKQQTIPSTDMIMKLINRIQANKRLRICPLCAKEDINAVGEPYFHVEHHIPFYPYCNKHNTQTTGWHTIDYTPASQLYDERLPENHIDIPQDVKAVYESAQIIIRDKAIPTIESLEQYIQTQMEEQTQNELRPTRLKEYMNKQMEIYTEFIKGRQYNKRHAFIKTALGSPVQILITIQILQQYKMQTKKETNETR